MLKQLFIDYPLAYYVAVIVLSFVVVVSVIPSIIHAAHKLNLFDKSDLHRKEHKHDISRLGGIGIFCAFTITVLMFANVVNYQEANFLLSSCIVLFAIGIKDDIYGVGARTKFLLQILVAFILVVLGGFSLSSLYGVFGLWDVHPLAGGLFSVALIIFIINAFNLIDGVDGLAGTVGAIVCLSFGILFALGGEMAYAFISFALLGSIIGFLIFNFSPAKIFMGDTGSLIIGVVSVVLAIKFIELNKIGVNPHPVVFSAPAIAVAILIIPVFDSLRIFFIRIINKKSPFKGDRNHIHHRLLRFGLSHKQVVILLVVFNVLTIVFTLLLQELGNFILIFLQIAICVIFNIALTYLKGKKRSKSYTLIDVFLKDTINAI